MNNLPRYHFEEDLPFLPKEIFSDTMFCPDLVPLATEENLSVKCVPGEGGAFVLPGEFGKCYEVTFCKDANVITAISVSRDPRLLSEGETVEGSKMKCDFDSQNAFMFVCRNTPEFLVIFVSKKATPLSIRQRTILQETDTVNEWFVPSPMGSLADPDGTFANYRWSSWQVIENLYEPYRVKYPNYISRTHLGKDQTGEYDMYGYVYTPETYKTTFFLTGGVHPNEEAGYYSLAKLMQLISDATEETDPFYILRQNVRFVVIPVVNVWGVSQEHNLSDKEAYKRIRYNSENVDLNRDFGDVTQQETKNVLAFFRQYADSTEFAMDFHNSGKENCSLWYNFINNTVNSQVNYKVTNHMYHRLMKIGLCEKVPNIEKIPGSYYKASMYLEGRIWNEFDVPTITVEHVINSTFPDRFSEDGFTLAVETYGNFLIQNALFFIQR